MARQPSPSLRTLVLRQAGLLDLCASSSQGRLSPRLASIDGAVDCDHPAFDGCTISTRGASPSAAAAAHATFNASILVGSAAARRAGTVLGICGESPLLNLAVVTDEMLTALPIANVAATLAAAVDRAAAENCDVILLGIEIRRADARDWQPLRESIRAAAAAGAIVVIPVGNRPSSTPCGWPEAVSVASLDWRGHASPFSPRRGASPTTIFAPGENIPGAGPGTDFIVRSGTSFAAAVAAGAFGLARGLETGMPAPTIAAALCPPPDRVVDATALVHRTATI